MNYSKLTLAHVIARLALFISFSIHAAEPLNLRHVSFANLQNKHWQIQPIIATPNLL